MKLRKLFVYTALAATTFGVQSCLDFDTPGDEFQLDTHKPEDQGEVKLGEADKIDYEKQITKEGFNAAYKALRTSKLGQAQTGIYGMRGGKEGGKPAAHAYQFQFSLGPDNYVQYSCIPHSDFPYSSFNITSTYNVAKGAIGGPGGGFDAMKKNVAPLLTDGNLDSIPELKAAYLLLYDYAAIENADLFGPLPYTDFKDGKTESPFKYEALIDIYATVNRNIDDCVKAFRHFKEKTPDNGWYDYQKKVIKNIFTSRLQLVYDAEKAYYTDPDEGTGANLEVWARFANSLKLRMAMHMSKVAPETAKKWAEEAVESGVIENTDQEFALFTSTMGFDHPIVQISEWGDCRPSASFINMLQRLDHPYAKYLFKKNANDLFKTGAKGSAPQKTEAGSVLVGMRCGTVPGLTQAAETNPYISFSKLDNEYMNSHFAPCYLMKLSEVCFLRAEGALRGWNMGGTAKEFYDQGIKYAFLEDRNNDDIRYNKYLSEYMNVSAPLATWQGADVTKYVDPTGNTDDIASATNIGVAWESAGGDREKQLEMIITQKYIAGYPYSFEAWVDLRRTGYPRLFPILQPEDGDGSLTAGDSEAYSCGMNIMRRVPWVSDDPSTLIDLNKTGLPNLGGPDKQGTRLWWDLDQPNF